MLNPGEILRERYETVKSIARGGQSRVYIARDTQEGGRQTIIKELVFKTSLLARQEEEMELFRREYDLLKTLSHRGIPEVYDYFKWGDSYYIAEEFIEGKTLEKMMETRGSRFSDEEAARIARGLLDIVDYLHSQSPPIILRDVKPSNIIVSCEFEVFFIDFTIAMEYRESEPDGIMMGSPGYAPPEQYRGESSPRSDIFSVGVTLYQLLTGENPVETPFVFDPVRKFREDPGDLFSSLVEKAVQLRPHDRFESAKAMLKALEPIERKYPAAPSASVGAALPSHPFKKKTLKAAFAFIVLLIFSLLGMIQLLDYMNITGGKDLAISKTRECYHNCRKIADGIERYIEAESKEPASIDELVPKYLQSAPACPADGKTTYIFKIEGNKIRVFCRGVNHEGKRDFPSYEKRI